MINFNKTTITSATALLGTVMIILSASAASAAPTANLKPGDSCVVTSGDNKGETGTYGSDGWCEGDWGGTECGTTKCKIKASRFVFGNNATFASSVHQAASVEQPSTTGVKPVSRFNFFKPTFAVNK